MQTVNFDNIILIKFPAISKNATLEINNLNTIKNFKIKKCIIEDEIILNNKEFKAFSNNLLIEVPWLHNKGGFVSDNKNSIKYELVVKVTNSDTNEEVFISALKSNYAKKVGYRYPSKNLHHCALQGPCHKFRQPSLP